ncbi:MAG: CBS domain-containing protein [Rhodocyclaceae bacterium]|nr:CBS domain-containing protein [Rhodocyclaceae bacterium]
MQRAVYKALAFRKLAAGASFQQPATYKPVQADSPAIEVMTDLQRVPAATTTADVPLSQATQVMVARSVRLLLVVDASNEIIGLITARDTMGDRPIKHIQEHGGKHSDLKVRDCMTFIEDIDVLSMSDVLRAEVGHIVATLKGVGRQHAMVVDIDRLSGEETVRGIFSISQIGRQLGMPLQTFEVAKTFAEIEAMLRAA